MNNTTCKGYLAGCTCDCMCMYMNSSLDVTSYSSLAKTQLDFLLSKLDGLTIQSWFLRLIPNPSELHKTAYRSLKYSCNRLCAPCSGNGKANRRWLWCNSSLLSWDSAHRCTSRLWSCFALFLFFFFLFCLKIPVLDSVIYDSVWIQIPLTKAQTLHENFSTHSFVFLCFFSLGYKVLSNINSN